MVDAGIGRLLIASLHQGIADVSPMRLEFYENWLSPTGLRDGRMGLAAAAATLSLTFLLRRDWQAPVHAGDALGLVINTLVVAAVVHAIGRLIVLERASTATARSRETEFRTLFESAGDGIFVTSAERFSTCTRCGNPSTPPP